jgi:hypothetical protein
MESEPQVFVREGIQLMTRYVSKLYQNILLIKEIQLSVSFFILSARNKYIQKVLMIKTLISYKREERILTWIGKSKTSVI